MELWDVHFNTIGVRTKENMDESLKKKKKGKKKEKKASSPSSLRINT